MMVLYIPETETAVISGDPRISVMGVLKASFRENLAPPTSGVPRTSFPATPTVYKGELYSIDYYYSSYKIMTSFCQTRVNQ